MTEWREQKLSDFMDFNPYTPLSKGIIAKKVTMEKLIPFNRKIQGYEDAVFSGGTKFKNGDTLVARITPCLENGKTAYVDFLNDEEVAFGSTEFIVLRAKEGISDSRFIFYFAISDEFRDTAIQLMSGTSGRQRVDTEALKRKVFTLPPLPEQIAIAEVLSSLDDKIDLLTKQNKTLEDLAQAYFRKWFIEDASDKWEEIPLGQLFVISSGKGLKKEKFTEHGQYRVLGANGEIGKTNEYLFNERLIYTGRVGTLGNVFIVDREPVWLSDNTLVFRNIKYFFFVYFSLKWANLADYNVGSTQPLIRQSDIKEIRVFMPDKERLDSFENLANSIFAKINSNQKQIQLLQKLRDTLLPKLISGEIRVKM